MAPRRCPSPNPGAWECVAVLRDRGRIEVAGGISAAGQLALGEED